MDIVMMIIQGTDMDTVTEKTFLGENWIRILTSDKKVSTTECHKVSSFNQSDIQQPNKYYLFKILNIAFVNRNFIMPSLT